MSSNKGFGNVPQLQETAEATLASGLAGWQHEVRTKAGQTFKFVPLHSAQECLSLMVHMAKIKWGGSGAYKYVPSGARNSHLFEPVLNSPLELSPNPEVSAIKPARFMLVYVVSGSDELKGHVGFIELRSNKKKNGTYDALLNWETNSGESVEGQECSLTRIGSGFKDTVYQAAVLKEHKFTKEETAVVELELEDLRQYLIDTYTKVWTFPDFQNVYDTGLINNKRINVGLANTEVDENAVKANNDTDADFPF